MALISDREPRAGQAGGRHRRGDLRPHRPAPPGRPLGRALPLPRGAHALVLGRRRRKSSTTASAAGSAATRSSSSRRRRGWASPRRSSCSPTATGSSSSARRRTRGPRRSASSAAASSELLDRTAAFYASLPLGLRRGGQGARVPGRARPRRGGAARLRRRLRAERLGQGAAARPAGRLQGRRAARGRPGPAGAGRGRVRPLPLADHVPDPRPPRPHARLRRAGDALRPGRQVRQHGRDRLLPQEPDALRASTWPRRRSPRRAARSWSRATPTCSPCTRRGSRRRSG